MSRSDSRHLTAILATLARAHADATALVMRELDIDHDDAELIVCTIRFGIRYPILTWAYKEAMNQARALGVDWHKLHAMVNEGEETPGVQGGVP